MRKIAYLGIKGLPSKGGAERVVEPIVQQLAGQRPPRRQWELTVYCNSRYTPRDTTIAGVKLVHIPTLLGKHLQPLSLFILSALHALFKGNYDLIHLHNIEACLVLPLLRLRYRVIATAHGSPIRTARSKWGAVARTLMGSTEYPFLLLSNCATSVSRGDAEYFEQRCGRVGHWCGKKVLYVPNGVKEQPVNPDAALCALCEIGVKAGEYILFAAGRIDPTKGCHLVLEAFYQLKQIKGLGIREEGLGKSSSGGPLSPIPYPLTPSSIPNMKLVIVGDLSQVPDYSQNLRRMADDRTLFIPHIAQKEKLFSIVQHCRLFIFPSLLEAMSMMLLEVAALGVPLICSDIPENKDVLDKYAVYFRSGDAKDLGRKVQWALENPNAMHSYAAKAQDWVKSRHSWEKIIREYEALYEKFSNHPKSSSGGAQEDPGGPREEMIRQMRKKVPSLGGASVLVVDADCRHGLSVVRSLGTQGCIVDVIVSNDHSPASVSRYVRQTFIHPCKKLSKDELAFRVGDILASRKYDVAIAAGSEGFQALSWGRESLSRFTKIPMPDYETFALAEDKARTMQFAAQIGLDIPATYYTCGLESVEAIPHNFRFPLVVKASGGQGHVFYAQDSEQLKQGYRLLCEEVPEQIANGRWPIIQEFIPGRSHGFFALLHEGKVLIHFMHERVRTVPPSGGASAIAKTHFNRELMDSGTRLLETLMWHGVAMAEFRMDARDGRYCLIEANPRFWGSLALAISAGVDFPSLLVGMALGINLEQYEYWQNPTIFQWLSMDIAYSFAVKKPWMWLGPVFRGIPNDFQLSDPKPNLSMILGGVWETLKGSRKLNRSTKTE